MIISPIKTRIFLEGENLLSFIEEHIEFFHSMLVRESRLLPSQEGQEHGLLTPLMCRTDFVGYSHSGVWLPTVAHRTSPGQKPQKPKFENGDILVITSKIVALSECRTFTPHSEEEKIEYIKKESTSYTRTKYIHLTIHDRMPMANAGIDESNGNGKCIMLPKDSYAIAYELCLKIKEKYQLANLGIIICDSRTIPFRNGTTGVSLGHAGFEGIRDYRGKSDIFGRTFHYARTNVPDALATAAVHVMGEGDECQPLAIIKNPLVTYSNERQNGDDLIIDPEDDMYAPIYSRNV